MAYNFNCFQGPKIFRLVAVVCVLFIGLTVIAMLLYPGGTFNDQTSQGYSFFNNFFSDLGMTRTRNDASNTISMILFTSASTGVGFGLAIFFIAFAQLFTTTRSSKLLSALGAVFGVVAGYLLHRGGFHPLESLFGGAQSVCPLGLSVIPRGGNSFHYRGVAREKSAEAVRVGVHRFCSRADRLRLTVDLWPIGPDAGGANDPSYGAEDHRVHINREYPGSIAGRVPAKARLTSAGAALRWTWWRQLGFLMRYLLTCGPVN